MKSVTADEAKRRFGEILKLADKSPVEITRHGKSRYVVMSAEFFDIYELTRIAQSEDRVLVTVQSEAGKLLKNNKEGFRRVRIGASVARRIRESMNEENA